MNNDIKVYITSIDSGEVTSRIKGYFTINGVRVRFNAIAFGRIGGHNVYVKLSKKEEAKLRSLGYDVESIIVEVQRMMVEGNIEIMVKD